MSQDWNWTQDLWDEHFGPLGGKQGEAKRVELEQFEHLYRGLYTEIVKGHLGYSKALGFDIVRSEHAPCNNAILIAKLRAGFNITSMEIDAEHGPSVILTYFHNPEQKSAYLYRCGMAVMTPTMITAGNGSMQSLREQFSKE